MESDENNPDLKEVKEEKRVSLKSVIYGMLRGRSG